MKDIRAKVTNIRTTYTIAAEKLAKIAGLEIARVLNEHSGRFGNWWLNGEEIMIDSLKWSDLSIDEKLDLYIKLSTGR